jgi:peptidoglycan/xylan/chitin deacetylase (PgdA/CDA1 family)
MRLARSQVVAWAAVAVTAALSLAEAFDVPPPVVAREAPPLRVAAPPPVPVAAAPVLAATTAPIVAPAPSDAPAPVEAEPFVPREIFFGHGSARRVALTFDDGPSDFTPRILRTLAAHRVRATFFVLGPRAEKHERVLAALDAGGHEIGNHGWSHRSMRSLFPSQIRDELERTDAVVRAATGKSPAFVRPPYGRYPPSALAVFGALGKHAILWTVDGEDWRADPEAIAKTVVDTASPGAIVLLHDSQRATADALPRIVEGLQQRGYEIVPVGELVGEPAYVQGPVD